MTTTPAPSRTDPRRRPAGGPAARTGRPGLLAVLIETFQQVALMEAYVPLDLGGVRPSERRRT
jgi:hypothetical protein